MCKYNRNDGLWKRAAPLCGWGAAEAIGLIGHRAAIGRAAKVCLQICSLCEYITELT